MKQNGCKRNKPCTKRIVHRNTGYPKKKGVCNRRRSDNIIQRSTSLREKSPVITLTHIQITKRGKSTSSPDFFKKPNQELNFLNWIMVIVFVLQKAWGKHLTLNTGAPQPCPAPLHPVPTSLH